MEKLNGWQRLGVIFSVIWALGAGGYQFSEELNAPDSKRSKLINCRSALDGKDFCEMVVKSDPDAAMARALITVPAMAFLPPILAWILAYAGVTLTRWVKAGFKSS